MDSVKEQMTLAEIAEASGFPARTIRFYIARGLMNGPLKGGRGAVYSADHMARLERIQKLQSQGRTLSEIAGILGGVSPEPAAAPATPWWQYAIADDVVVWVRAGSSPWRTRVLRAAIDEFSARLQSTPDGERTEKEK
jgi:DNA-binding transcriptional MerR regulator